MSGVQVVSHRKQDNKKKKLIGLQRLKWYCQACEKQCRDENGFKCHKLSASHKQRMMEISSDPSAFRKQYSEEFQADFVRLLRISHGEKMISANKFYNEYIQNKEHIHMNATRWHSLSAFVHSLGSAGICKVEESENQGLMIAWIDGHRRAVEGKEKDDDADDEGEAGQAEEQELSRQIIRAKKMKQAALSSGEESNSAVPEANAREAIDEGAPLEVKLTMKGRGPDVNKGNAFDALKTKSKVYKAPTTNKISGKHLNAFKEIMLKEKKRNGHDV